MATIHQRYTQICGRYYIDRRTDRRLAMATRALRSIARKNYTAHIVRHINIKQYIGPKQLKYSKKTCTIMIYLHE